MQYVGLVNVNDGKYVEGGGESSNYESHPLLQQSYECT
jgi:hypothetical protein